MHLRATCTYPGCRNLHEELGNEPGSGETAPEGIPEKCRSLGRCPLPVIGSVPFPHLVHSGFQCPEVPMSRRFDSGFQCLGVPMSRGENLLCCLKVELPS